ncbi:MAG: ParB family transcriptional regulator, chromosome partitioning protein, partial [Pseudomonadota bacterium]|nr:ParB family transcriptional regulator, chromosome partitioning protein [Pseudomonadota bacterium]
GRIQLSLQLAPQHREAFAQGLEQLLQTLGEGRPG